MALDLKTISGLLTIAGIFIVFGFMSDWEGSKQVFGEIGDAIKDFCRWVNRL